MINIDLYFETMSETEITQNKAMDDTALLGKKIKSVRRIRALEKTVLLVTCIFVSTEWPIDLVTEC